MIGPTTPATDEGAVMSHPLLRWAAIALACLLATGCKEKHEPVKPTVSASAVA
jgi:hypothetical protein